MRLIRHGGLVRTAVAYPSASQRKSQISAVFSFARSRVRVCAVQEPEQQTLPLTDSSTADVGSGTAAAALVGEDAAVFDPQAQSVRSWGLFFVLLTTVLGALYAVSSFSSGGDAAHGNNSAANNAL
jgi:hypothetical protein